MSRNATVRRAADANKRSKQLLREHFQELEGGGEDNSSGAEDEDDEDEVSSPPWPLLVTTWLQDAVCSAPTIGCKPPANPGKTV